MSKKIAFIGYGLRSEFMMNAFKEIEADITVSAIADPDFENIKAKLAGDPLFENTIYYKDGITMLDEAEMDGVFIGTRCSLHTDLACEVLKRGLPLFLEKPVCINMEQYLRLREAGTGMEDKVVVSFPLRLTAIVDRMKSIVDSGELGQLSMVQAVNNANYGSVYYHSWYRDPKETGGLFLQKTTHDIDYIRYLIGEAPSSVFAHREKTYFKGNHRAGLHCPDCEEYRSCIESSYVVEKILKEDLQGDACCFAVDTGNEDAASAMFMCESGVIISYNQNFIVKRSAARRGCRIIGTRGCAEFDFNSGKVRLDSYDVAESAVFDLSTSGNHFGGDQRLAQEFMKVLDGKKSGSGLKDGLISAACCLAATRSADENLPVAIEY